MRNWIIGLVICALAPGVLGIGVSPSSFGIEHATRGSEIERTFFVSGLEPYDRPVFSVEGDLAGWFSFSSGETQPQGVLVTMTVTVPEDIPNGNYSSNIRVRPGKHNEATTSATTISVIPGIRIVAMIEVRGDQIRKYEVTGVSVPPAEKQDNLSLIIGVNNKGNVASGPQQIELDILDKDKSHLLMQAKAGTTATANAFSEAKIVVSFAHSLETGQYWGTIRIIDHGIQVYTGESLVTILPEHDGKKAGSLAEYSVPGLVTLGSVIPIKALFKNEGEIKVTARLITEITRGGRLHKVIEGGYLDIMPGEEAWMAGYFTPEEAGDYAFEGYVTFGNKQTPPKRKTTMVVSRPDNHGDEGGRVPDGVTVAGGILFIAATAAATYTLRRRHP